MDSPEQLARPFLRRDLSLFHLSSRSTGGHAVCTARFVRPAIGWDYCRFFADHKELDDYPHHAALPCVRAHNPSVTRAHTLMGIRAASVFVSRNHPS